MNRRYAETLASFVTLSLILLWAPTGQAQTIVLIESRHPMSYLANRADPGIGMSWVQEGFNASAWPRGTYGIGYEATSGAQALIRTAVPAGTLSVYTRATFSIADASRVTGLFLGADYDDGYAAWINGVEVYRSPQLPAGTLAWSVAVAQHESSNASSPRYGALIDITARALPALHDGTNLLAVGVWNAGSTSSDLVLVPQLSADEGAVAVTRGPYLQLGTQDGVTVRWRTSVPTDSVVRFGAAPGSLGLAAGDGALTSEHAVRVTGLAAGSRYFYSVGTSAEELAGNDAAHSFTTAPAPGTAGPQRIWVVGDSGTPDDNARAVRDAFASFNGATPTDLWLMLGDNAYADGTDDEYQAAVFDMYPDLLRRTVLWPTLGNHDGHTADSATQSGPYYDIFTLPGGGEAGGLPSGTEAYYAFDHGDIHFVCLDSYESDRSAGGAMMTWLAEDLASTTRQWIVAFWHHPPYSKGSHNSDTEAELVQMRQNALPILEAAGVDLVLTGHSHSYERSFLLDGHYGLSSTLTAAMKVDGGDGREDGSGAYRKPSAGPAPHEGAVYVVAGCGSEVVASPLNHPAMFLSLASLGSLVLDIDGSRLDGRFLDAAGVSRDHFTLVKGAGAPPAGGDQVASGEVPVAGTIAGSYLDTRTADGIYEALQEALSGGKPSNRRSYLDHKWTFDVAAGSAVTFLLKGYHSPSSDGDHFVFAYSTDDATYTDMLTLTKIADDGQYVSRALPATLGGRVYVRARDTNHAAGARLKDTLFVDHMLLRTEP